MTQTNIPAVSDGNDEPQRFRKKPVEIEAWQVRSPKPMPRWLLDAFRAGILFGNGSDYLEIKTLEGTMRADPGDWVIQGIKGELYPCKPDIFASTYESVDAAVASDDVKALVERLRVAAAWLQDRGAEELMLEATDMLRSLQHRAEAAEARVAELERGEVSLIGSDYLKRRVECLQEALDRESWRNEDGPADCPEYWQGRLHEAQITLSNLTQKIERRGVGFSHATDAAACAARPATINRR